MQVEFVRFKASDGVELQGWLTERPGDKAVLHIHGKSGNGYENHFLDTLRQMYNDAGISFFSIDTRGRGVISWFRQGTNSVVGGSCYEIFEESLQDIQGAVAFLQSRGKSTFILQGHSLGCAKVIHYALTKQHAHIEAVVLLAPTDMIGWASKAPDSMTLMSRAKQMVAEGKSQELLAAECGLDKTPMSAASYVGMHDAGSAVDLYGQRSGGPLVGRIASPMLIAYGDQDIGIMQIDGTVDAWLERVHQFKNSETEIMVLAGAGHSFGGYEQELAVRVQDFLSHLSD